MPSYKLWYWNLKGRALVIRLVFAEAGIAFEDVKADRKANVFSDHKATGTLPYDQWPVLEVDGVLIAQSMAIARFVAKRGGLYPTDDMEAARVDATMDSVTDFAIESYKAAYASENKEALCARFKSEVAPKWIRLFERQLGDDDFLVNNKMSVADIFLYGMLDLVKEYGLVEMTPKITAFVERIGSRPNIKKYMDSLE